MKEQSDDRLHDIAPPRRRRRWFFPVLIALAIGGGLTWWWLASRNSVSQSARAAPAVPVLVSATPAKIADVPVYFTGLGVAQAFNTVTVRSRVDGEVHKIAFVEGQMVKSGDLLAQIDSRPFQAVLDQAQAKLAQDQALLANAKLDLGRYSQLAQRDYASKQQVDTQQATVNQLTAQIQGDQAAIDNAKTQLGYTTIRSPINGRVGFRLVDQGNIVHASDQNGIVVITQLQPISVVFTAPERELPAIAKALASGTVPAQALSQSGDVLGEGSLTLINNEIDQLSGSVRMKATFPNETNKLWPGQSVSVRILIETLPKVVTVPADAVQRGTQGLYAYVVRANKTAEMRRIEIGLMDQGIVVVRSGIKEGELAVTAGQYRLRPDIPVQISGPPSRDVSMVE
jgi:multidrug efflux system membrane fusion protein